ncbi:uncharacterized protein LOC132475427 [Gadus macrocephalus]|uniref:uncharacterized protein LOC132475427 n=1 Tax=Gadus macrocephalus TaxID=80720 RepID=UPI0028CB83E2|nr:uncharacterized protein LOC132475427 [Gadus macrocephalus]
MTKTVIQYLLLSTFVWLLNSLSVSQTVEVEAGDTVTFSCRNVSDIPTLSTWMRAGRTSKPFVISTGYGTSPSTGRHSDGIQQSRFVAEYGASFINLTIMKVNSSDSGWYYCIFYIRGDLVVNSTWLLVHENGTFHAEEDPNSEKPRPVKCEGNWIMVGGLFGSAVIILVLVIVGLVFRIAHQRKLQKDTTNQPQLQESQVQKPELAEVCYSMLSFRQKNRRGGPRPKDLDTAIVYTATRRL